MVAQTKKKMPLSTQQPLVHLHLCLNPLTEELWINHYDPPHVEVVRWSH